MDSLGFNIWFHDYDRKFEAAAKYGCLEGIYKSVRTAHVDREIQMLIISCLKQDDNGAACREFWLEEPSVRDWIEGNTAYESDAPLPSPGLKILITQDDPKTHGLRHRMRCSRDLYLCIQRAWELPVAALTTFLTSEAHLRWHSKDTIGIAFRTPYQRLGCIISFDLTTHVLHAIVQTHYASFEKAMVAAVQDAGEVASTPCALPFILLMEDLQMCDGACDEVVSNVMAVSIALGRMDKRNTHQYLTRVMHERRVGARIAGYAKGDSDFPDAILDSTNDAVDIAVAKTNFVALDEMLASIVELNHDYIKSTVNGPWNLSKWAGEEMGMQLQLFSVSARASLRRVAQKGLEVEANIKAVNSLIARRDSFLNRIAAETWRRDSADMRVIACATLIFLPGTYVATIFDIGFFNWKATTWSGLKSKWMWLYWVITVGLTALVILGWVWASSIMKKRSGKILDEARRKEKLFVDLDPGWEQSDAASTTSSEENWEGVNDNASAQPANLGRPGSSQAVGGAEEV